MLCTGASINATFTSADNRSTSRHRLTYLARHAQLVSHGAQIDLAVEAKTECLANCSRALEVQTEAARLANAWWLRQRLHLRTTEVMFWSMRNHGYSGALNGVEVYRLPHGGVAGSRGQSCPSGGTDAHLFCKGPPGRHSDGRRGSPQRRTTRTSTSSTDAHPLRPRSCQDDYRLSGGKGAS